MIRDCLYCGPYPIVPSATRPICPSCGLDPDEVQAIELVRSVGFGEAYKREYRRARQRGVGES